MNTSWLTTIVPCRPPITISEGQSAIASWEKFFYAKISSSPGCTSRCRPRDLGLGHSVSQPGKSHPLAPERPRQNGFVRTRRRNDQQRLQSAEAHGFFHAGRGGQR